MYVKKLRTEKLLLCLFTLLKRQLPIVKWPYLELVKHVTSEKVFE